MPKVFERLASFRLGRFMVRSSVLPTTQFTYLKVEAPVSSFCVSHTLQSALESLQEARIVQIDFSADFERPTINEFSKSSTLWVFEVLRCLY